MVTSFEFQLYPLDKILGGLLFYPLDVAKQVLRVYREVAAAAPDRTRLRIPRWRRIQTQVRWSASSSAIPEP